MDKQRCIAAAAETEEDRLLLARLYDKLNHGAEREIFSCTAFLSPREQAMVKKLLPHVPLVFFGGCDGAERCMACYVPEYLPEDYLTSEDGPAAAVRAVYYEKDALTHRDFLGSLMGSGIKRETVGDIYVGTGSCDFLVTREILPYVLDNLVSAGRTKLHLEPLPLDRVAVPQVSVKEIRDTVSSLRLDSITGSGFGLARGKAAALIAAEKVSVNSLPCLKPDKLLCEGDQISARGFGKLVLQQVGGKTKKDRISIVIEKYV